MIAVSPAVRYKEAYFMRFYETSTSVFYWGAVIYIMIFRMVKYVFERAPASGYIPNQPGETPAGEYTRYHPRTLVRYYRISLGPVGPSVLYENISASGRRPRGDK